MTEVKVLFFARSRELTGVSEATVAVNSGTTSEQFIDTLMAQVSV